MKTYYVTAARRTPNGNTYAMLVNEVEEGGIQPGVVMEMRQVEILLEQHHVYLARWDYTLAIWQKHSQLLYDAGYEKIYATPEAFELDLIIDLDSLGFENINIQIWQTGRQQ